MKCLPLYVDKGASLTGLLWLEAGLQVWREQALFAGGYFLPLGTLDGEAALVQWASYADAAAAGRAPLRERVFPLGSGVEGSVPEEIVPFWAEHSGRAALSSRLAALEVERSRRVYVGRWLQSGSNTYVRACARVVGAMQLRAEEAARTGAGHELHGEERLGAGVKEWPMYRWRIEKDKAEALPEKFTHLLAQGADILAAHEGAEVDPGAPGLPALGDAVAPVPLENAGGDESESEDQGSGRYLLVTRLKGGVTLHRQGGGGALARVAREPEVKTTVPPGDDSWVRRLCWPPKAASARAWTGEGTSCASGSASVPTVPGSPTVPLAEG